MNNPKLVSHEDVLELLFANRNRAYGAYQLRRTYNKTLTRALIIGLILIAILAALPNILKAFAGLVPVKDKIDEPRETTTIVYEIPPQPPIIPSTPPPPARATQRFVPPVVDQDDKIADEPPPLSNDALLNDNADIGKVTVQGPTDAPPTLDDAGLGSIIEPAVKQPSDEPLEMFDLHKPPSFPGGEAELFRYLAAHIQYPDIARESNIQGQVVLSFVIDRDGSISNVQVLKELGGGCSKEAVRVLKSMPKWSPGEANGHAVKVRFTLPVRFTLN